MTKAITARQNGDDLQAMLFIIECCRLLYDHEHVKEVGFEVNDAKGFDDIKVLYSEPIPDGCGDFSNTDYIQVKYHTLPGKHVTVNDLTDPRFIGATSESLLQKVHRLQKKHAPNGEGCRFILRQPLPIADDDALCGLVDQRAGFLRLDTLFSGGSHSKMGKLRESLCKHLDIDTEELKRVLRPLRIQINPETLEQTKTKLNQCVQFAGFRPVDSTHRSNPYLEIPKSLAAECGEVTLDCKKFTDLMKSEGLYLRPPLNSLNTRKLVLKSFSEVSSNADSEPDNCCSFIKLFDDKNIKNPDFWNSQIYPKVSSFYKTKILPGDNIQLRLDCHYSITYTAGHASARIRAKIWPEQGVDPWIVSGRPYRPFKKIWEISSCQLKKGSDIAVLISVSQDLRKDAMRTIDKLGLHIGFLIDATVLPNIGRYSVQCADHAYLLAQDLMQYIQKVSANNGRRGCIHLFVSMPNAMMFFMGQEGYTLPEVQLYEYNNKEYTPSILIKGG